MLPFLSKAATESTTSFLDALPTSERRAAKKHLESEFEAFLRQYPRYKDTECLDRLRKSEFSRLEKANEVYVDYMGGCLWPKSLVTGHADILKSGLFGNTHSDSPCATRSDKQISLARTAVLDFFDAPASDYVCIFTSNATNALKIVGENFPFEPESSLILPADCHNSVNGLRQFAHSTGATVDYLACTPFGGFDPSEAEMLLAKRVNIARDAPSLFVLTGQSNITGLRPSLSTLSDAKKSGFYTLVDAAALASSARISLRAQSPDIDALAVSFYKIFGYPTGVGALIAKKSFLSTLKKKWFSGGTVDFVQAPGQMTLQATDLAARFEEGTLNYSSLSAIAPGLEFVKTFMGPMSVRLPILHHYLHNALESLVYPGTQMRLVKVHTRPRPPPITSSASSTSTYQPLQSSHRIHVRRKSTASRRDASPSSSSRPRTPQRSMSRMISHLSPFSSTGLLTPPPSEYPELPEFETNPPASSSSSSDGTDQGYVVSCTFYTSSGALIPLAHVSHLASRAGISLRTGCVCNPGGAAALRGKETQARMERLSSLPATATSPSIQCTENGVGLNSVGEILLESAGVVRISLGVASNFEDVQRVVSWAKTLLDEQKRDRDLAEFAPKH
ncbi:hypothetical protein FRC20_010727 [Serendipita sp. 405]|nr:hypothetical protein FRC20_010727 [Serendipita sp. 405]